MRFPNTGTGFEAEETRDFKILNGRVTMRNRAGSAAGHAMQHFHHFPTPDEGFELYWEEMHKKHAQACTDALVASHHQPRNLNIVRANQCAWQQLARSEHKSVPVQNTLKQFSDEDPSFQRAETKGICSVPQRNRVIVAFFGQERTTKKYP